MSKKLFLPLPGMSSDLNITQKVLSGLGKSTKRGIKKCYSCGVYNGTRSTMCKNKECGAVLKDSEEKSKVDLDAVKLLTGTEKQVFSVRVRDMGPDYRGFVQLPVLQSHSNEDANIFSEVALCFVDSCQNSFDNSILKCHEEEQNENNLVCGHIKSALKSQSTASPMEFKNDMLHSLKVVDEIKEKLYLLATEKEGSLVQRVSKSIMAVKCQVSPKHPLGYLHFTFIRGKGKDSYEKYCCSCEEYSVNGTMGDKLSPLWYKCIHYYACIWALASDSKYYEEFSFFMQNELPMPENGPINVDSVENRPHLEPRNVIFKYQSILEKSTQKSNQEVKSNIKDVPRIGKRPKKKERIRKCQKIMPKILPIEIKVLSDISISKENLSWNFIDWLSYVTESINHTMQFNNCGILNTLVFQMPQNFYDCFTQRIPSLYEVTRTEVSFNYNIMNILHLKNIFDTPQVKLRISKKFVHTEQKGYVEYDENVENSDSYQCSFIFFLNVGQSTVDESDNTNNSFVIEWIPSVTVITNIGQLKLHYKYGRKST